MKAWERTFVMTGLALAGFAFLIAAVRPALGSGSLNATFLLFGAILIVGAGAAWSKVASGPLQLTERRSPTLQAHRQRLDRR